MKKQVVAVLLCAGIFSSFSAYSLSFKGLLGFGAEFGGDRLLSLTYSDGSISDIRAGQGISAFGGAVAQNLLNFGPVAIDLQGTVGVKYSTIPEVANAGADFYRFPIELLAFARWKGLRAGIGPACHIENSFSGSGELAAYDFSFDTAFGVTAQVDYVFLGHWGIGARYTSISYQPQLAGASPASGSNFGAEVSYFF
jgi:hypothetical protein